MVGLSKKLNSFFLLNVIIRVGFTIELRNFRRPKLPFVHNALQRRIVKSENKMFILKYLNHFYNNFDCVIHKELSLNTDILAYFIFDYYPIAILLGGLILLIAMIGAIMLTLPFFLVSLKIDNKL